MILNNKQTLAAEHNVTYGTDSEAWHRTKVVGIPELLAWVQQQGWRCDVVSNGPQSKSQIEFTSMYQLPEILRHLA